MFREKVNLESCASRMQSLKYKNAGLTARRLEVSISKAIEFGTYFLHRKEEKLAETSKNSMRQSADDHLLDENKRGLVMVKRQPLFSRNYDKVSGNSADTKV